MVSFAKPIIMPNSSVLTILDNPARTLQEKGTIFLPLMKHFFCYLIAYWWNPGRINLMKHSEWLLNCLLISRLSLSWTNCNTFFCILTSNINNYFYFIFKACICNNDKQNLYIMIWHRYIYIFFWWMIWHRY